MKFFRARPMVAAALAVAAVFGVAISVWGLVEKISLPEQQPLLESILWFITWLAAIAFGAGAWALAYAEVRAKELLDQTRGMLNAAAHGFTVLAAVRDAAGAVVDFRLTFANQTASSILDLDEGRIGTLSLREAGWNEEIFEKFRSVVEKGGSTAFEQFYQRKELSCWLYIRAAKLDDSVVSTFADVSDRKQAEQDAVRNQKLLEMTGHMTRSGGWEILFPERHIVWSPEVREIHEVEEDFHPDLQKALSFYVPGSFERITAAVEACEREGKAYDLELEIVTTRGNPLWVHTIGCPEYDEDGVLRRIFGTFQDITDYKKAELEAMDSREELQMALSGAAMGRWDWDVSAGRLQVDETVARILGRSLSEMEPTLEYWDNLIHPDDLPEAVRASERHLNGESPLFEAEYRMRGGNGSWIWVLDRGKGLNMQGGRPTRIVGTLLDITAKKTLQEERTRHLEVLEKITSQAPGAVYQYRVGADGRHTFDYVSKRIQDVYDRTAEELMAEVNRGYDLIHPDDAERIWKSALLADAPESEWRQEFRIYRRGELRWILDQSTPEVLPEGGTLWHGFLMDITGQKRIDQQLIRAKEEAEEAGRAKSEFLAMMSHEIRTPMNAIMGFADLLSQRPLSGLDRDYVNTIADSGEALLRIIDDILDHSRIESGRLRLESNIFSPEKLLDDISILLTPSAEKKGLGIEVVTVGDIPLQVRGDMGRLRQIILNLAGNAVKFSPEGMVSLGVTIPPGEPDPGLVRLRFFVRDSGPGIPAEKAARIFEPFAQADSSVSRRHGGTGLGLAISRSLATLMGGYLWFESEPDQGATFLVEIPFGVHHGELEEKPAGKESFDHDFAERNPLRLMAVDDDAVNLKLVTHVLEKLGYHPRTAMSGEDALALCRAEWPECILLDMQMPGLDGLEVTRRLREIELLENRPPIFIAALTANVLAEERHACFAAGMSDYLTKPLRNDMLARVLVQASRSVGR